MKKIGLLVLALVFALGALGVGYAHWSDEVYIDGIVETGEVLIGFVSQDTDDPEGADDPCLMFPDECPDTCQQCEPGDKDVATTTCELFDQKDHCCGDPATHLGVPCYETLVVTLDNVYPQYCPTLFFDIANCGSIPVHITSHKIVLVSVGDVETEIVIDLPKCTMVPVDFDGDGDADIKIGLDGPEEPQQLHPCDVGAYELHFCVLQECPQCASLDFEIEIEAIQWNKAP